MLAIPSGHGTPFAASTFTREYADAGKGISVSFYRIRAAYQTR